MCGARLCLYGVGWGEERYNVCVCGGREGGGGDREVGRGAAIKGGGGQREGRQEKNWLVAEGGEGGEREEGG